MSDALQEMIERAKSDPKFLHDLVFNPMEATKSFKLSHDEREAIAANSAERLIGMLTGQLAAGCGSSGTCDQTCNKTCGITCTKTFTSLQAGKMQEFTTPAASQ